jgi:hypothetical protein
VPSTLQRCTGRLSLQVILLDYCLKARGEIEVIYLVCFYIGSERASVEIGIRTSIWRSSFANVNLYKQLNALLSPSLSIIKSRVTQLVHR